ncbi:lactonase family protein [Actinocrispum wychmicini]|uniref:Secreted protein n=1 Tax=Actinocrispum wychmicini TaxID=1213861 RepID=A0A4R2J3M7_9PSEU|nr:lactonase family protein [Actinocrispum wychmicini]TCO53161.1 secreted protein [Actinocrispum wychmicini]
MANELNRRGFLGAVGAGGVLLAAGLPAEAARRGGSTVYIGSYTPAGPGLQVGSVDPESGTLTVGHTVNGIANPSWFAFSCDRRTLFTTNENDPDGGVTSFSLGNPTRPRVLNSQPANGSVTTHVSVHASERYLLASNYGSGSVSVLPVDEDGRIGPVTDVVQHTGDTRDPHAHQTVNDPTGQWVLSVDLGADSVYVYSLDVDSGKLALNQQLKLPVGAGPRHLAFHPNGRHVYILGELRSEITVATWDPGAGRLTAGQVVGTLGGATPPQNFPAEVQVSADGRFVYASNRGHDSIATFSVARSGELAFVETTPCGGHWPRHFTLDPTGRWVYVSNQLANTVSWLSRNPSTGKLGAVAGSVAVTSVGIALFR